MVAFRIIWVGPFRVLRAVALDQETSKVSTPRSLSNSRSIAIIFSIATLKQIARYYAHKYANCGYDLGPYRDPQPSTSSQSPVLQEQ